MDISRTLLTLVGVMLTVEHKKCQKSFFGLVCDESDGRFQEADVCLSVLGKTTHTLFGRRRKGKQDGATIGGAEKVNGSHLFWNRDARRVCFSEGRTHE